MAQILLMEPDAERGSHMTNVLTEAGHHCTLCTSMAAGLDRLHNGTRTMTVLNARMPWSESAHFLRALESKGLPVLFITSDLANAGHLHALYQADSSTIADGFTDQELVHAVEHLLDTAPSTMTLGSLTLNTQTHRVSVGDQEEQPLTLQEYELLYALMNAGGATVTREQLLRTAWGYQSMGTTRTVDVHVQRLRRKLGSERIETIYKLGYRLCAV